VPLRLLFFFVSPVRDVARCAVVNAWIVSRYLGSWGGVGPRRHAKICFFGPTCRLPKNHLTREHRRQPASHEDVFTSFNRAITASDGKWGGVGEELVVDSGIARSFFIRHDAEGQWNAAPWGRYPIFEIAVAIRSCDCRKIGERDPWMFCSQTFDPRQYLRCGKCARVKVNDFGAGPMAF